MALHHRSSYWIAALGMSMSLAPVGGSAQEASNLAEAAAAEPASLLLTGCVPAPLQRPRELAVGACYRSTLDESDPETPSGIEGELVRHEDYELPLRRGETVLIDMDAIAPAPTPAEGEPEFGFDTYLEIFASRGGEPLRSNDDRPDSINSTLLFRASRTSTYTVRARSFLGGIGDYVIRVRAAPPPQRFDGTVHGRLEPADTSASGGARYVFDGNAGDRMRLALRSTIANAALLVEDSSGDEVGSDSSTDGNIDLVAILPHAGPYIVSVTADGLASSQEFALELTRAAPPAAPPEPIPLVLGQEVTGRLTLASEVRMPRPNRISYFYQAYSLPVEAGQSIVVEIESSDFRPGVDLAILSPLGYASIPTSGPYASPLVRRRQERSRLRLEIRPERAGTLILRARGPRTGLGTYTLRTRPEEPAPAR